MISWYFPNYLSMQVATESGSAVEDRRTKKNETHCSGIHDYLGEQMVRLFSNKPTNINLDI